MKVRRSVQTSNRGEMKTLSKTIFHLQDESLLIIYQEDNDINYNK
jgi:hypothetical protein